MLEIILLIFICKGIGKVLRGKGRNPILLQVMTVLFWFGGEVVGAIAGAVVLAIQGQPIEEFNLTVYLCAIAGAGLGVAVAFAIAYLIPPTAEHQAAAFANYSSNPYHAGGPTSTNPYNPYDGGK